MAHDNGDWSVWKNLVLASLKENAGNIEKLELYYTEIRVDVGKLKLISVILGAVAGMLGTLSVMLIYGIIVQ